MGKELSLAHEDLGSLTSLWYQIIIFAISLLLVLIDKGKRARRRAHLSE